MRSAKTFLSVIDLENCHARRSQAFSPHMSPRMQVGSIPPSHLRQACSLISSPRTSAKPPDAELLRMYASDRSCERSILMICSIVMATVYGQRCVPTPRSEET